MAVAQHGALLNRYAFDIGRKEYACPWCDGALNGWVDRHRE